MAFKTRRQKRYDYLRIAGFLAFEARELSRVPLKVPYMAILIRERYRETLKARDKGLSWVAIEQGIKKRYKDNGWFRQTRAGKEKRDPWKMLKDAENRYRDKRPGYESPWEKRRKKWKSFLDAIEREYARSYPKGDSAGLRGATGDRWLK